MFRERKQTKIGDLRFSLVLLPSPPKESRDRIVEFTGPNRVREAIFSPLVSIKKIKKEKNEKEEKINFFLFEPNFEMRAPQPAVSSHCTIRVHELGIYLDLLPMKTNKNENWKNSVFPKNFMISPISWSPSLL